jgi:coenzyme F420-reducing hydrogenase alpha subunit
MKSYEIHVHHITRVEGHGNVVVNVRDGRIEDLKLEIVESPRFFEAMLEGRTWEEAATITSRICGICALGHTIASVQAAESAMGITPDEETVLLRKLLLHAETIQSHILHLYFLVAPDLFEVGSVIPLASSHPELVRRALRLKKLGNEICEILVGRKIHPIGMLPGGFTRWPLPAEIQRVRELLEQARPDLDETVTLFTTVAFPEFHRRTEYVALSRLSEYAFYDGDITSSNGTRSPVSSYRERIRERIVSHSAAKHAGAGADSFAVGALARFNVNHAKLRPWAKRVAGQLGMVPPVDNPYHNNTAQLIEVLHCYEDALDVAAELSRRRAYSHRRKEPTRHGRGVGATEVPRGTLYHEYDVGADGRIREANCIIPTGQNLANIEADMHAMVGQMAGADPADIQQGLETLVRAYDPCISCATHFLEIRFV